MEVLRITTAMEVLRITTAMAQPPSHGGNKNNYTMEVLRITTAMAQPIPWRY